MLLRPYQAAAVQATYDYLRTRPGNPCIVIPTAGGKTPVIAQICQDATQQWNGRVAILAHVKELIAQAAKTLTTMGVKAGLYSAGLKRRDLDTPVVAAGIQSIYKRACDLGPVDLILVDEAHLIPPGTDGEGMYRSFLQDAQAVNPNVRVIGLTATPFRMKSGMICGEDSLLTEVCYEVGVRELIRDGYLCPPISKGPRGFRPDTSGLHTRAGEFIDAEVEALMDVEEHVIAAVDEIVERTAERQTVLIFASGVQHGQHIQAALQSRHGVECGFICGKTPSDQREELIRRFKGDTATDLFGTRKPLKYLCNVNVLTTGFDAPNIDCVVLLRPTLSPGLYYQMIGRGFRLHPDKVDFLVLDFGENVTRHGPVDKIKVKPAGSGNGGGEAPAKECPECNELVAAGYARCPACNFTFPPPERSKHGTSASDKEVVSGVVSQEELEVQETNYREHTSRQSGNKSMRVDYVCGLNDVRSEWISFEHPNEWVKGKAAAWWKARSPDPVPITVAEAVDAANGGALCDTHAITVTSASGQKFDRITDYQLGELPPPMTPEELKDFLAQREQHHEERTQHVTWLGEGDDVNASFQDAWQDYPDDDIPF